MAGRGTDPEDQKEKNLGMIKENTEELGKCQQADQDTMVMILPFIYRSKMTSIFVKYVFSIKI